MIRLLRRSTFGRRMVAVLLLCVLAPAVLLGFLSLRRVESKLREDTLRRMRYQTREIGSLIYSSFRFIEEQAKSIALVLEAGASPAFLEKLSDGGPILGVSRILDGSRSRPLRGKPCPPPPLDRMSLAHLLEGKGLLYLARGDGGSTRIFLANAVPGTPPERELLSFEVNPEYLWDQVRNAVPSASDVVVLSPGGEVLLRTGTPDPGLLERIPREAEGRHLGNFEWREGPESRIVFHAMVFLKPIFLSERWTVAIIQPRSETFGPSDQFLRVLFLTILLVVFLAVLFTMVQIRRNLAPLAVLKDGTRRISSGDFNNRIEVYSGDEF